MASFRRALSSSSRSWPHHNHLNHKPLSLLSSTLSCRHQPRIITFLLFFVIGFLLGFSPFADLRPDFTPSDLHSENRSSPSASAIRTLRRANRVIETSAKLESWSEEKLLIVVTPTSNHGLQAFYLSRLGHTLRLVRAPLLWIVVEVESASSETADVLRTTGVMYRHLVCEKNSTGMSDTGVSERNAALEHIERHKMDGIVYFADEDGVYSLELFERMREIRRFGTWPVAILEKGKSKTTLEGPVCNGSQIIGWHTNEKSKMLHRFYVDMSGFAFNSTILWDPKRWHRPTSDVIRQLNTAEEFQDTTFIEQIIEDESQMEAIPSDCSKFMTWHLHLDARGFDHPRGWRLLKNLEVVIPL